jgi:hypothetical protein
MNGWIGVDLDGTLAHYESGQYPDIGKPLEPMVNRILNWLEAGEEVRIMTARAAHGEEDIKLVADWLRDVAGLPALQITCEKDQDMEVLWDDRAIQVRPNTGEPIVDENLQEGLARTFKKKKSKTDSNSFELMASLEKDSKE